MMLHYRKGNKERLIPLNDVAIQSINHYLNNRNHIFAKHQQANNFLFMTRKSGSGPIKPNTIWYMVKHYVRLAGLDERYSTHTLRHAFATHLLHNGANLRVVQQLLGHAKISTTQLYTNLPDQHLQNLHRKFHPRA